MTILFTVVLTTSKQRGLVTGILSQTVMASGYTMKTCRTCKQAKNESEFYTRKERNSPVRLSLDCKQCFNEKNTQRYHSLPDDVRKDRNRRDALKQSYGISPDDYNRMFDEQNGCCAICGKHQSQLKKRLYVDHNHKTGKVRKLLCQHCNTLLGFADDNENVLQAAIRYLRS